MQVYGPVPYGTPGSGFKAHTKATDHLIPAQVRDAKSYFVDPDFTGKHPWPGAREPAICMLPTSRNLWTWLTRREKALRFIEPCWKERQHTGKVPCVKRLHAFYESDELS